MPAGPWSTLLSSRAFLISLPQPERSTSSYRRLDDNHVDRSGCRGSVRAMHNLSPQAPNDIARTLPDGQAGVGRMVKS